MTLQERIEEREFKKELKKYKIRIFILLFFAVFFGTLYKLEEQRCENIKTMVISYDYERGRKELIKNLKEM